MSLLSDERLAQIVMRCYTVERRADTPLLARLLTAHVRERAQAEIRRRYRR